MILLFVLKLYESTPSQTLQRYWEVNHIFHLIKFINKQLNGNTIKL